MGVLETFESCNPGARILLYLTPHPSIPAPDIVPLAELASEVYNIDSVRARGRALNIIVKLRRQGWQITRIKREWKGEYTTGYLLDAKQAAMLWDMFIVRGRRWAAHIELTPNNVLEASKATGRKSWQNSRT